MNQSTQTFIPFDLSRGALGIDRKRQRTLLVKPVGKDGIYVKFCHLLLCCNGGSDDSSRSIRTNSGVMESEISSWLTDKAGVVADGFEWHPLAIDPEPDTYYADKILAEIKERDEKRAEGREKRAKAKEKKARRVREFFRIPVEPSFVEPLSRSGYIDV